MSQVRRLAAWLEPYSGGNVVALRPAKYQSSLPMRSAKRKKRKSCRSNQPVYRDILPHQSCRSLLDGRYSGLVKSDDVPKLLSFELNNWRISTPAHRSRSSRGSATSRTIGATLCLVEGAGAEAFFYPILDGHRSVCKRDPFSVRGRMC